MSRPRPPYLVPLLLVVVAFVVRWIYNLQAQSLILFHEATGDSAQALAFAARFHAEGWLAPRGEAWFQAPFYPAFLALIGADPNHLEVARFLQYVAGTLGVLLAWDTTRRLAGPTAALVAGLAAALYAPAIFFAGEILSISWALLFLQGTAWLLVIALESPPRRRPIPFLLAGLLAGLAALAQPNALLAGVAAFAWLLATARRDPGIRSGALAFLAALVVVIAPVTIRNRIEAHEWIPISANGGINFFLGNNPDADGTFHLPAGEPLLNDPDGLAVSAREAARKALGHPVGAAAASSWWFGRGFGFWTSQPFAALTLTARKTLYFLNGAELPNHYDMGWFRERIPILRVLPGFLLLAPLAVWGFFLLARRPVGRLLAALAIGYALSVILFFVTDRYRLPVVALFLPAAGFGLVDLLERIRTKRGWLPASLTVALFLVLAAVPLVDTRPARAHMHNLAGTVHYRHGEIAAAQREFEEAQALSPESAEPANNLGRLALLARQPDDAERWFRKALELDPHRPEAWFNLEELMRGRRRFPEALACLDQLEQQVPGAGESYGGALAWRRGLSHQALGDTARARADYEEALRKKPDLAGALTSLGALEVAAGHLDTARRLLETSARLSPSAFTTLYNLGLVTDRGGDYPAARSWYRKAVDAGGPEPELSRARQRLRELESGGG